MQNNHIVDISPSSNQSVDQVLTSNSTTFVNVGVAIAKRLVLPPAASLEAVDWAGVSSSDFLADSQYLSSTPPTCDVSVDAMSYSCGKHSFRLIVEVGSFFSSLPCIPVEVIGFS